MGLAQLSATAAVALATCLTPAPAAEARSWHVATDGSDAAAGDSRATALRSWQRAIDLARPGDTILVAPGTYRPTGTRSVGAGVYRSGTRAAPITLRGDGGRPVLDCGRLVNATGTQCLAVQADWWRISDVEVTGALQPADDTWGIGITLYDASHNVLDRVAAYGNQGGGIWVSGRSVGNLVRDCDAHHNYDVRTRPVAGEDSDGVAVKWLAPDATGNEVVRCRAWANSDDGFDLWESEAPVLVRGSWAFRNGYVPGTTRAAGNGVGFKLGRNSGGGGPRHRLERNLAFENRTVGFAANGASAPLDLVNNTAFANLGGAFELLDGVRHRLRNNVAVPAVNRIDARVDQAANAWSVPGVAADARDFRGSRPDGADAPRNAAGALPRLPFLRLAPGSDLVDRGVDVGLPYRGGAPDLGAFESAP